MILQAVEELLAEGVPHGKICIGFTPDEEIGMGASGFDVKGFGADFAYTVDAGISRTMSTRHSTRPRPRLPFTASASIPALRKIK